jgi:hypothetical protein
MTTPMSGCSQCSGVGWTSRDARGEWPCSLCRRDERAQFNMHWEEPCRRCGHRRDAHIDGDCDDGPHGACWYGCSGFVDGPADVFDEIAEGLITFHPKTRFEVLGVHAVAMGREMLETGHELVARMRVLLAERLRTIHAEAFEAGFECALDIAVRSVNEYADAEAKHARTVTFGKDVSEAMRLEEGTRYTIRVNGIRASVGAIRAARDRMEVERRRASEAGR